MKIMKHLLLILVGGILLNACSDDREICLLYTSDAADD